MRTEDIPRDEWINALDRFSKQHEGWIVTLEVDGSDLGAQPETTKLPLVGISADVKGNENRIAIIVGGRADANLNHFIEHPRRLWFEEADTPAHDAVAIEDEDGRTTVVHFNHFDPDQVDRLLPEPGKA